MGGIWGQVEEEQGRSLVGRAILGHVTGPGAPPLRPQPGQSFTCLSPEGQAWAGWARQAGQVTVTKEPSLGHSLLLTGWRGPRTQYPQPAHLENGA